MLKLLLHLFIWANTQPQLKCPPSMWVSRMELCDKRRNPLSHLSSPKANTFFFNKRILELGGVLLSQLTEEQVSYLIRQQRFKES